MKPVLIYQTLLPELSPDILTKHHNPNSVPLYLQDVKRSLPLYLQDVRRSLPLYLQDAKRSLPLYLLNTYNRNSICCTYQALENDLSRCTVLTRSYCTDSVRIALYLLDVIRQSDPLYTCTLVAIGRTLFLYCLLYLLNALSRTLPVGCTY